MNYRRWFVGVPFAVVLIPVGLVLNLIEAFLDITSGAVTSILDRLDGVCERMKNWIREKD